MYRKTYYYYVTIQQLEIWKLCYILIGMCMSPVKVSLYINTLVGVFLALFLAQYGPKFLP